MKSIRSLLIVVAIFFSIVGCGGDLNNPEVSKVKGGELIADFPANLLKKKLLEDGAIDQNRTVFGFKAYKIPYTTTDEKGNKVKASGIMVVPTDYNVKESDKDALDTMKDIGLAIVLDAHGTIFSNQEAPSVSISNSKAPEGSAVIYSALSGFITLQPDYIGYGDSKKSPHPYLLEKSSSNTMVDFLKASIDFAKANNIPIVETNDIYLTGYSQGGYVAMAALEDLEKENFNIRLATPMAGPYLLAPIAAGVLAQQKIQTPSFMAAVALSYSQTYDNISLSELIQEPYAKKLKNLFNKELTRKEIDAQLTTNVSGDNGLFTNYIVQNIIGSNFFNELNKNSVIDFRPITPIRFIKCKGDDVIPYQISEVAELTLKNSFSAPDVALIPVEPTITHDLNTKLRYNHVQCAAYAYSISANIFAATRKTTLGY